MEGCGSRLSLLSSSPPAPRSNSLIHQSKESEEPGSSPATQGKWLLADTAWHSCAAPALGAQHVSKQILFACGQGNGRGGGKKSIKKLFVSKHPSRAHVQRELPGEGGGGAWTGEPSFPPADHSPHLLSSKNKSKH